MLSISEVYKEYEDIYESFSDVPDELVDRIFSTDEGDVKDYASPLRLGKGWTFCPMAQYQPKTANALLSGGPLRFVRRRLDDTAIYALITEVNGAVVQIGRNFWGRNPDDPGYDDLVKRVGARLTERWGKPMTMEQRHLSLPEPIRKAYYQRIDGLNLPNSVPWGIVYRLLPRPTNGWNTIEGYLSELRLKKKHMPVIEERIAGVKELENAGRHVHFMLFLDTRPSLSGLEGDALFVKNHIQDGVIYLISNGDVPNMMILEDPATAIDCYCEHVLKRNDGRFDFRQYARPM